MAERAWLGSLGATAFCGDGARPHHHSWMRISVACAWHQARFCQGMAGRDRGLPCRVRDKERARSRTRAGAPAYARAPRIIDRRLRATSLTPPRQLILAVAGAVAGKSRGIGPQTLRESNDMAATIATGAPVRAAKPWYKILYLQVLIAILLGVVIGWLWPNLATHDLLKALGHRFIKLIKMWIPPTLSSTV